MAEEKNPQQYPQTQLKVSHLPKAYTFSKYPKQPNMNRYYAFVLLLMTMFYGSCAAVETIFKAGMWWGIILVVGAIALIFFIIAKVFGGRK